MSVGKPSPRLNPSVSFVELSGPEPAEVGVDLGASWVGVGGKDML